MAFARQQVLDVINKGQYHSCVMTCYTFNFQFFELKVMRTLRAAGVKNILVLIDGSELEKLASHSTGLEFLLSSGFSIYPIYVTGGVFHPKLTLLFGKKDGLLTLGSGNLTASGLGNNDEAWGSFQVQDLNTANAALFADAWHYVPALTADLKGVAAEKIDWIKRFTPWLGQLPAAAPGTPYSLEKEASVALLTNKQTGILPQVLDLIGKATVEMITCVSPYYDKAGQVLKSLQERYPKAKLRCVVEGRAGSLPIGMKPTEAERIAFYPWQECGARKTGQVSSRLHAKLVHFATSKGEYLLLGSANVTASGMGRPNYKPRNEEASLLLFRPQGNYLQEMGIKVPTSESVPFAKLHTYLVHPGMLPLGEEDAPTGTSVHIVLAEQEAGAITLHLKSPASGTFSICLLDADQQVVFTSPPTQLSVLVRIALPEIDAFVSIVEIRNEEGKVVGRQFVQFPAEQYKYCPDERLQKLQMALDDLTLGGMDGFAELLDLVEMEDADAENGSVGSGRNTAVGLSKKGSELMAEQKVGTLAEAQLAKQRSVLGSPNVRIVDFLNTLGKNLMATATDEAYSESTEQGVDVDTGAVNQAITVVEAVPDYARQMLVSQREVKCLDRFLKRLYKNQAGKLKSLTKADTHFKLELPALTLRDLATFNVAMHVAISYVGKHYVCQENGQEWNEFFLYKTAAEDLCSYNCLKGICNLTIGHFLLQATGGFQHYDDPVVQKRMDGYRQAAFEMATFLVVNTPWKESERDVRDLLLCNASHYLRPQQWPLHDLTKLLAPSFATLKGRAPFAHHEADIRLGQQLGKVMPQLQQLQIAKGRDNNPPHNGAALPTKQAKALTGGEWVFLKRLGVCLVSRKYTQTKGVTISLSRPGFPALGDDLHGIYEYNLAPENGVPVISK